MNFSLELKPLGTVERYVVHADDCELEILAGWGAGLNAWRVPVNGKKMDLLYGYRDAETFRKIQFPVDAFFPPHAQKNGCCKTAEPFCTACGEQTDFSKNNRTHSGVLFARRCAFFVDGRRVVCYTDFVQNKI